MSGSEETEMSQLTDSIFRVKGVTSVSWINRQRVRITSMKPFSEKTKDAMRESAEENGVISLEFSISDLSATKRVKKQ